MSVLADLLAEVFREPTLAGVARELATLAAPLWLAALVGLLIGWAWRPRWAAAVAGHNHHEPVAAAPAPAQAPVADHLAVVPRDKAASVAPVMEEELAVGTPDLMHLRRVVEEKDGGPAWTHMMDRTLPTFRYQAWKREPQLGVGFFGRFAISDNGGKFLGSPVVYLFRTIHAEEVQCKALGGRG